MSHRNKSQSLDFDRRTHASVWYRDGVPIETIAMIPGHADTKTTWKSYARPSIGMIRKEMAKGNPPESRVRNALNCAFRKNVIIPSVMMTIYFGADGWTDNNNK